MAGGVAICCALAPCAGFAVLPAAPKISSGGQPGALPLRAARLVARAPTRGGKQIRPTMADVSTALAFAQIAQSEIAAPAAVWARALANNALAVDAAVAAALYCLGILTSSAISKRWEAHMHSHLARWSLMGIVDGVAMHSWYKCVQGVADSLNMSVGLKAVFMTMVTSALYTPIFCAGFLFLLSILEGKGLSGAQDRVRADFRELLGKTWKVWVPTNVMLFAFVPLETRTIVSMALHYVYLVGLALWDAAIRDSRAAAARQAAPGPESANFLVGKTIHDSQLRMAVAFTAVEMRTDLSLGSEATDLPTPDA